jgi:hypothetical protein
VASPPEPAERQEKDEVDLAFDQMLAETGEPPAAPPDPGASPVTDAARPQHIESLPPPSGYGIVPQELPGEHPAAPEAPAPPEAGAFDAGTTGDVPLEFAPEETLELPTLSPERSGPEAASPQEHMEDGFLVRDSETLDFLGKGSEELETVRVADISLAITSAPIELDTPPPPELETTALAPAADFIAPPQEDLPLEGNVTPEAGERTMQAPPYVESGEAPKVYPPPAPAPYMEPSPGGVIAPRSAPSRSMAVGAVLLVVLLAAGGYFGFTASGRKIIDDLVPRITALLGGKGGAAPVSRYEVKNVIGYYESGAASSRMLVIKGQVTNLSKMGKSSIRVHAALLDINDQVLGEKSVYAGNMLSGAKLKTGGRDALEKALDNPLGERLSNMDVLPGKTVPFMVLFFDAPENIDSYRLEARDNE